MRVIDYTTEHRQMRTANGMLSYTVPGPGRVNPLEFDDPEAQAEWNDCASFFLREFPNVRDDLTYNTQFGQLAGFEYKWELIGWLEDCALALGANVSDTVKSGGIDIELAMQQMYPTGESEGVKKAEERNAAEQKKTRDILKG